ncbi:hypothetical protein K504DRAFT_457394 [Pleomassaria siparia CBS 279.74]|uniref:Ubiquitin-like domain-containing protein n=1 Tax=Pleomassaria siparia CBS 279.74 TaxID=1314801 RepID=A0A6G1KS55_9PLEO|nr:hypothetical protein K504DRAFT_457394 [Pleomassaria siparia CBS 279.74]
MSEVTFCKQFLSALDARPVKLSSDHIADPRQYPAQNPYTLPRLPAPHPQRPTAPSSASTSSSTISITLKPMKSTQPTVPLLNVAPSTTSMYDLKSSYSTTTSFQVSRIKILYKKKPVADTKTVLEVIGPDAGNEVEFSIMVMGGAVSTPVTSPPAVAPPSEMEKGLAGENVEAGVAQGPSGKEAAASDAFWVDLHDFVIQRLKDEREGERLVGVFKKAWESDR